jgi:hypothetical protein
VISPRVVERRIFGFCIKRIVDFYNDWIPAFAGMTDTRNPEMVADKILQKGSNSSAI